MVLSLTEVGPRRPQVTSPIISFPIASWPSSDCPSPPDGLYPIANCSYKTFLPCWIIQHSKLREIFHQNKKHKAKAQEDSLAKIITISLSKITVSVYLICLIYLGLLINDHSTLFRAMTTVNILLIISQVPTVCQALGFELANQKYV